MHVTLRTARQITASVLLGCFAVGVAAAHSAHAIDHRLAVHQARAAAADVDERHALLENSLTTAALAVQAAAEVSSEDEVSAASHALAEAMDRASATIAQHQDEIDAGAALSAAPESATTVPAVTAPAPTAMPDPRATAAVTVDDVTDGASAAPTPSAAPTQGSDQAEIDAPRSAAASGATPASLELVEVLEGATGDPDEARSATERLADASEELERAAAAVEAEAQQLARAAQLAAHETTLVELDSLVEEAEKTLGRHERVAEGVDDRVAEDSTLSDARDAASSLTSALDAVESHDRDDPAATSAVFNGLRTAVEVTDGALEALHSSHEAWVEAENARRDAANDELLADHDEEVAAAFESWKAANRTAVAQRDNGWSGRPTGVKGSNGRVASSSMCDVDFLGGHRLQCDAARALELANDAYRAQTGSNLTVTDTYRSYGLQVRTRALKPRTAAVPGTSNHGWGMAVDLDHGSAAWLAEHGAAYGWVHPRWARPGGARPEFWHLEYVAADVGAFQPPAEPDLREPVEAFSRAT